MSAGVPAMTSMYATPQMTSMVAPQYAPATTSYAAAPTMTSMYMGGAAPASVYMPAQTMAAPTVYAAPTMVETIAAPQVMETFVAAPTVQFGVPQPVKLTQGLVEPAKLEAEKVAYGKALEAQLKKQTDAVMEEANIKKAMLEQQAKTQRAQFQLQIEEQLKMSCLTVDQEAATMCYGLEEAAITQKTSMEERAAMATADYTKKKALEEMSIKSWECQRQWFEKEAGLQAQYQQVMQKGSKAVVTSPVPQIPVQYGAAPVMYVQ